MKFKDFDKFMRQFECLSMEAPFRNWIVLHVDGDNFHRWTKKQNLERPFDSRLREYLDEISYRIMMDMNGIFTLHQSDEMSVLLSNTSDYLGRSIPKLISKSVAIATSVGTLLTGVETKFATRVFTLPTLDSVIDYYRWRLADAVRNSLNMCVYWTLRDRDEVSGKVAARIMDGKNIAWKNEYLFKHGINFDALDGWMKRGHMLYWIRVENTILNSYTEKFENVERRELIIESPHKDERVVFTGFLRDYIENYRYQRPRLVIQSD